MSAGHMRCGAMSCCATALVAAVALLTSATAKTLQPECPRDAGALCRKAGMVFVEEDIPSNIYFEVSGEEMSAVLHGDYFNLDCGDQGVSLQSAALPRFSQPVQAYAANLEQCAPPASGSYAAALAALNLTAFSRLSLQAPRGTVTRAHLEGLARLDALEFKPKLDFSDHPDHSGDPGLAPGALADLPALRELQLDSVRTPPAELARLPRTLETLYLWYTGAERVHLNTLPKLKSLNLRENIPVELNVSGAHALEQLDIQTPNLRVPNEALPLSVRHARYSGWNDTRAEPLTRCLHLQELTVLGAEDNSTVLLPDAWVANCPELASLYISGVPLRATLPAGLLAGARALQEFTCRECSLMELPAGLFDETSNLLSVDLSGNQIKSLPSKLFEHARSLKTLDLSHNQLASSAADSLAAVFSLKVLRLHHNQNLSVQCDSFYNVYQEPLAVGFRELTELYLHHTDTKHACYNWRDSSSSTRLSVLDMDPVPFENLTYRDLLHTRDFPGARVLLGNGGEFNLLYTREDYETVLNGTAAATSSQFQALVEVSGTLRCDCHTYWAVMAFRSNKFHVSVRGLQCGDTELGEVDVDSLTCDASAQCASLLLPAACTCAARDDLAHGAVVTVTCERANLTELPRLPRAAPAAHTWRLHLAHNNISHIRARDTLSGVVELDVRNNSIKTIDGRAAAKLANIQLYLAGNDQLECGCEAFQMLTALLGYTSKLRDAHQVKCRDGKLITEAPRIPCTVVTGPAVVGSVVMLTAVLIIFVFLSQPKTRQRIVNILIAMGWLPPRPEPKGDRHRRFDVFVSYAHEDEQFVVEQLVHRLESGECGYRVCMHQRDWAPGEWIPAQISASVRSSRRTVAVVSRHYIRSPWARAEFREAHAATLRDAVPRLVVVLLDEPDTLPLDAELRDYVRHNTYVRWGDVWFWEKLRQALPPRQLPPRENVALSSPNVPCHDAAISAPPHTPSPATCENISSA